MKRALVTGSNGGLGRAIVERLRSDGYDVVTMDMTGQEIVVAGGGDLLQVSLGSSPR